MTNHHTHYRGYDVMEQSEHWDPHTREIVEKRISKEVISKLSFFTQIEAELLEDLCSVLLDEKRIDILSFIINHFDSTLSSNLGESQRKKGTPTFPSLLREGLRLLEVYLLTNYKKAEFSSLSTDKQKSMINGMLRGELSLNDPTFPMKEFAKNILSESVSALYSHPDIWSEIGYGGPAYPRGYVRSEIGLTDPWEAKKSGK